MMDEKPSLQKCRLRVMKFEKNASYSSKHEMRAQSLKPAKVSRARKRSRSPDAQASTTASIRKQDRKRHTRTVGTKPVNKHMVTGGSSSIAGELKRIFSSSKSGLNSVRDAHPVGVKAKKTKKKAKDETASYKCEMNESPRRARNEFLRYPSMYYLSAGDSIERELCEPKAIEESCDCFITELTNAKASRDRDSLSRRDNRKYSQDSMMRSADQGESVESCHNLNSNRHIICKQCNCKSGMPEHPTSTCQTVKNIDIRVDGQTSPMVPKRHTDMCNASTSILYKNASCACPSLNKNITRRTIEKTTQPSKMLTPKMLPNTNTYAAIGYDSRALANDFSKNVTNKCPTPNMNLRSSQQGVQFFCTSCEYVPERSNLPDQLHRKAGCECPSPKWSFKRLAISAMRSLTEMTKRLVNVQTDCPALPGPATITDVSVQTSCTVVSDKLCLSVSCSVDEETDFHPLRRSPLETPKCISRDTSYLCCFKIPRTTQYEAPLAYPCDAIQTENDACCKVSCGSLPVKRTLGCASSPTAVNGECIDIKPSCPRMRKKPTRCTRLKNTLNRFYIIKKIKCVLKSGNYVETDVCSPQKICDVEKIHCYAAEIGCLNDSCRAGPRRVYALFPPFFTRSKCYFYYIIYVITMIVCSPFVAIIYFCRFVTSPIRPSRYDCGEICPPCVPPRPCPHVLIRLFKCRQWFDKPTTGRVGKIQKRPSVSKYKTKCQREIIQHSTCCPAKACKNGTKTPQILTEQSVILSRCSTSRSRVDQKIPRTAYKPTSCEDQIIPSKCSKPPPCKYQTIPSKCFKPPPCEYQIIPTKYSKASSVEHETILSKYCKGSSRGYEIILRKSSKASSCGHEIIPRKFSKASSCGHEIILSKY